ncbi:hypothetical protein Taro_004577 [Colocasia esculenta]|uniref:Uncharacterized protein n=1 Tax=Colocasia esculenta TaxID=4460 RepID=A0A843TMQ9_COLES|nr:hypothetical protein [Colocasia esculenta]
MLHYGVVSPGCASAGAVMACCALSGLRFLACGFRTVLSCVSVSVLCRLEPWCIVLYLGWLLVLVVALSVVRQALVVACVLVFPLAYGASVYDCGTLLRSGSLEVDVLSLTSVVVSVPAWLCVFFVVGMLVPALSSVLLSVRLVTVRPIGLLAHDYVVCRRCEVSSFGLTSDVFRSSVAVCPVVERVVSQCCGSACVWCPCQTTRTVWVRPSGDSGYRFCVLRFLRVCLLSLLDCEEGVSRVAVGNCALCRALPATEWVSDLLVPTVRSVGGCSRAVFGWLFPLFGPDLASLGTCGVVVPFGCPFVWRETKLSKVGWDVRLGFPAFLPVSWMTRVASWVPDATVIRVAASLCVAFLSRLGCLSVLVAPGQQAATVFCRVALSGRLTPVRVTGVSVRPVALSRCPWGARSCCGRWARCVKVRNATGRAVVFWVPGALGVGRLPLPLFFPLSPFPLFSGGGEAPLRRSGVVEAGGSCGAAERRSGVRGARRRWPTDVKGLSWVRSS